MSPEVSFLMLLLLRCAPPLLVEQGFDREYLDGTLLYQLHAFSRQITNATLSLGHDMAFRQQAQSENVRQMTRIGFVAAMFEAIVLFDRRCVRQMNGITRVLQAVHQPVPIEGRFDDHAKQLGSIRTQRHAYFFQVVGVAFGVKHFVALVRNHYKTIVGMQVYATK